MIQPVCLVAMALFIAVSFGFALQRIFCAFCVWATGWTKLVKRFSAHGALKFGIKYRNETGFFGRRFWPRPIRIQCQFLIEPAYEGLVTGNFLSDWQYLLLHGTNAVGAAALYEKDGKLEFIGLYETDFSNETLEALRMAEQMPQVKKSHYELRRLDSAGILFVQAITELVRKQINERVASVERAEDGCVWVTIDHIIVLGDGSTSTQSLPHYWLLKKSPESWELIDRGIMSL